MEDINDTPVVDFDKCNGCGVCLSNCPGLAIFIIDETYSDTEALVKLPYEFLPLPALGDTVSATDRAGETVCDALVVGVINTKANDRTPAISIAVPKNLSMTVRGFRLKEDKAGKPCGCDCVKLDDVTDNTPSGAYICRCEEITVDEIRQYIAKGYTTLNEIKIVSRAGMGACQGRTCRHLILGELSKAMGVKPENMPTVTFRPPSEPIKMSLLANAKEDGNE
jgi:bacterioferritin-associated ferredoxin